MTAVHECVMFMSLTGSLDYYSSKLYNFSGYPYAYIHVARIESKCVLYFL